MISLQGIPVLETERLRLRGLQAADFEPWAGFMASDRAHFVGGPASRAIAWRGFCNVTGHWVHRGYSFFVMADRASDRALGLVGPWFPEGWPEREIGWQIWDADAEGQGLAFEAATAARNWAYRVLGWPTAISLIAEGNARSEALALRMGCTHDGDFVHETFGNSRIFRHPSPEALT